MTPVRARYETNQHADTSSCVRDRHLFSSGPKRVLALDGGGVRGAISIAFLERIEELLQERLGKAVRLCDYFDLIGGTSTGAIIAAGLSLGLSATQIREFYLNLAPRIFRRSSWRIIGLQAKFDSAALQRELVDVLGDRSIDSTDILTGLAIMMKRIDTGSPWIISNNPRSTYWEHPADGSYIGNRSFSLANLVRASTAAPHYFDPELIAVAGGSAPGLFVDGGVSPHNNPALQLLLMAVLDGYRLQWETGADRLLMVSVGTGNFRYKLSHAASKRLPAAALAVHSLTGLISDTEVHSLTLLHWLSGSRSNWPLNSEIGNLEKDRAPNGNPLMTFRRYDARLDGDWVERELGLTVSSAEMERLRCMDDPGIVTRAYEIGRAGARKFIKTSDFPECFDALAVQVDSRH